jgi:hypothetical protein
MRRVNHRGLHLFGQQVPFLLVARRQKQASCGNLSALGVETSAFRDERGTVRNRRDLVAGNCLGERPLTTLSRPPALSTHPPVIHQYGGLRSMVEIKIFLANVVPLPPLLLLTTRG